MDLAGRDLLKLSDLTPEELSALLTQAADLKRDPYRVNLRGRVLGLLFQKASTRTRVSFTAAMAQCGGSTIDLLPTVMQVSRGEPLQDTARVLSRYLDVIAIRTYEQKELEAFADYADIPVINALTDQFHPCQILADLLTIQENFGQLAGLTLTYCGDGNNVAHSLMLGCAMSGIHIRVATPPGYEPDPGVVQQARTLAQNSEVLVLRNPQEAVSGSQVIYTDVWASMGQEAEAEARQVEFLPYQVNAELMKQADPEAIVLHCLPAHREEALLIQLLGAE
jgi:ornithine carbamoyltransferase